MNSVFRAFQRCDRFTPFAAIWICVIFGVSWPPQIYAANFQLPEFTLIDRGEADAIVPSVSSKFPGSRFAVTGLNSSMGTIRILRVENDKNCSAEFCPTFVVHAASEWKVLLIASREGIVEKPSWDYLQIVLKQKNGSAIVRFTPQEKVIYLAQ